jgi:hypothetical protein
MPICVGADEVRAAFHVVQDAAVVRSRMAARERTRAAARRDALRAR